MAKELNWNGTEIGARASNVKYDNSTSGLEATNVQDAITELKRTGGGSGGGGSVAYAPFNGKRMAVVGDSFSAGGTQGWMGVMKNRLNLLETRNGAISGGSWTGGSGRENLCAFKRLQLLYADYQTAGTSPDYILIVDGVNDYGNSLPIGDISFSAIDDVTNSEESALVAEISSKFNVATFTGGAQAALAYIAARFPNAIVKIGFTPAGQQGVGQGVMNNGWDSLAAYTDRLKTLALMYGVQYIDTFNAGICSWVASNKSRYWNGANDGHPSSVAHARIGEYMARILLNNL